MRKHSVFQVSPSVLSEGRFVQLSTEHLPSSTPAGHVAHPRIP